MRSCLHAYTFLPAPPARPRFRLRVLSWPLGRTIQQSVFVCMLNYSDPVRPKALRNSVLFLGHRFPNVRKTVAEAMYLKLLANEEVVNEVITPHPS